jgi:flagellar protein FlbD
MKERATLMILVTRLNKASQFYVNEDMIEFIEETPDTIITLNTAKKITVSENAIEIVEKIREEKIRQIKATQFTM